MEGALSRKAAPWTKAANFSGGLPVVGRNCGIESTDKTLASERYMTHLRHWLIAAALLSATHSSGLAAELLEGVHAAVKGELSEQTEQLVQPQLQRQTVELRARAGGPDDGLAPLLERTRDQEPVYDDVRQPENGALLHAGYAQESLQNPPMSAQRVLASGWEDSEPAGPGMIQGKAAGVRLGLRDAVLASHAVQPLKRIEIGLGLSNDALVNGFMGWYGVYLQGLDRVAERNTIYGLLRETPRPGLNDSNVPPAFCCRRSDTLTSLEQFASTITARQVSPTFFLFGMLRKKGWNLNLEDGWKLQAGVRHMQYSSTPQTKVGFFTVERYWESFRTSYSYQVERSSGVSLAPSHVLQLDYLYSPRDSIGVSFANGRELAYFGPLGILNTEVRNAAVRGQHWFKQDWALTFQAGYNDHGSLPTQKGVRMGLRHSF